MTDLCTVCLCADRKLCNLQDTNFAHIYTQILSEISVYVKSEAVMYVQLCWECVYMMRKFERFKQRVKSSYLLLQECADMDIPKLELCHPSRLQIHHQATSVVSITECCKAEDTDALDHDAQLQVKVEYVPHEEPETFVNEVAVNEYDDDEVQELPEHHQDLPIDDDDHCNQQPIDETDQNHHNTDKHVKKKDKKKIPKVKKKIKSKTKIKSTKMKLKSKKSNTNCDNDSECESETEDIPLAARQREIDNREHNVDKVTVEVNKIEPPSSRETEADGEAEVELTSRPRPRIAGPIKRPRETLPDKPTCVECGKQFSSKKTYRYHLNVLHKGNNSYPCGRCDKVFQWKSNLGRHMRSHKAVDSDELHCALCDKRFASIATYRQHLAISRRHVPENQFPFSCDECGKRYVSKTRLRDHIDWEHLNNIKFRCTLCDKPFKCHTSLYVHRQNVHRDKDKKNNLCHVCGKSYQNPAKLKYHIVAMHTSQTPYQCTQCTAAFGWYSSLYRHVREVHYKMKVQQKKRKRSTKPDAPPTVPLDGALTYFHSTPQILQHAV